MKTDFRRTCIVTAFLCFGTIACSFFAAEASAAWPTRPATRCWSIDGGAGFLQSRINPLGGGFYSMSNIIVVGGIVNNVESGTAYMKGSQVLASSGGAGKNTEAMWTGQAYLTFDKNTMLGQYEGIGHDRSYKDMSIDTEYNEPLTLTPVSCTLIWQ